MVHLLRKSKLIRSYAAAHFFVRQDTGNHRKKLFQAPFHLPPVHRSFDDHGKLIPADPSDLSILTKNILQIRRDLPQDLISHGMAESIIDGLKIIHIHKQKPPCFSLLCPGLLLHFLTVIKKHSSSHHTGQPVQFSPVFFVCHIFVGQNEQNDRNHIQRERGNQKLYLQVHQIPGNHIRNHHAMLPEHIRLPLRKVVRGKHRHAQHKKDKQHKRNIYLSGHVRILA